MSTNPPSDHDRPFEDALLGELLAVQQDLSGTGVRRPKLRGLPHHWASADGDHRRARTWGLTAAALLIIAAGSAIGTGIVENSGGKAPTNTLDVAYLSSAALSRAPEQSVEYITTTTTSGGKTETVMVWRHGGQMRSEVLNGKGVALRDLALSLSGAGNACRVAGTIVSGQARDWVAIHSTTKNAKPSALNDVGTDIQKALASGALKVVGDTTLHGQKVIELKGTMRMGALPGLAPGPLAACIAAPGAGKASDTQGAQKARSAARAGASSARQATASGSTGTGATGNSGPPAPAGNSGPGGGTVIACPSGPITPPPGGSTGNSGPAGASGGTGPTGSSGNSGSTVDLGGGTGSAAGSSSSAYRVGKPKNGQVTVTFFGSGTIFDCVAKANAAPAVQVTLWVNPKTFLPVQVTTVLPGGHQTTTSSFSFLPVRPASVAALQVVVPQGYKLVGKTAATKK